MNFVNYFIFNSAFSSKNSNSSTVYSLLILGLFFISLAVLPNLNAETVSDSFKLEGDKFIMSRVKQFPPIDSFSSRVNFESL